MELSEIATFLAVVEASSFSDAAQKLFISQSTLSGRIQSLEKDLKAPLFNRGKGIRNISLTPQGQTFLPIAQKYEALWKETEKIITNNLKPPLTISAITSISSFILPEVYKNFSLQHPEVNVHFLTNHASESYSLMESRLADVAFVTFLQYSKQVVAIPLYTEEMVLVCNENIKLKSPVHPSELDVSQGIFHQGDKAIEEWQQYWFGSSTIPKLLSDNVHQFTAIMENCPSWCILPATICSQLNSSMLLNFHTLTTAPKQRTVYMLLRKNEPASDDIIDLLANLRETVKHPGVEWLAEHGLSYIF